MGEGLVGLGHLVDVLALLDGFAFVLGGGDDLVGELQVHGLAFLAAGGFDDPFHGQRVLALGTDFARNLVVGSADAARTNLHGRGGVLEGELEDFNRILDFGLLLYSVHTAIDDGAGGRLLALLHDIVDELGDLERIESRIGLEISLYVCFSAHVIGKSRVEGGK